MGVTLRQRAWMVLLHLLALSSMGYALPQSLNDIEALGWFGDGPVPWLGGEAQQELSTENIDRTEEMDT